ncbi:AAC(3) family N-acetyltransferase [Pelagicoccus mobilis]|uniref:Aminoglycoside N(3)-acetyltransferase n=1 Tax=Pelagicoccus mobilis TaxID=415221 RepID=A0A934RV69_9BACT|nr:AAC(3) family N-acetyltransferase [Pelagicoccus mobilis]MBK1878275.1 AAC(3) family N-acetyltransferase [Pelagicoccus mobilis]
MSGTRDRLANDLRGLGIERGDTLLVHSSLKSLGGGLEEGPSGVIEAFLDVVGPEGTLCFPGLSYLNVTEESPVFDVRSTPGNVGLLPEVFRKQFATHRSLHPTHSVCALGALAEELTSKHFKDRTPCGENSPFSLIPKVGGKLVMLGCSLCCNTTVHAVEEVAGAPYTLGRWLEYEVVDWNGEREKVLHDCHLFDGYEIRYDRLEELMPEGSARRGKVLAAETWVADLGVLWQVALEQLRREPFSLVDKV